MSVGSTIYNTVFKRASTYTVAIIVGAYFLEGGIDATAEYIFNEINRGKLWHHIKDNYKRPEE